MIDELSVTAVPTSDTKALPSFEEVARAAQKTNLESIFHKLDTCWSTSQYSVKAEYLMMMLYPVKHLPLSPRVCWSLERVGIRTLYDLLQYKPGSLKQFIGIGKGTIKEIEAFLQQYGLRFGLGLYIGHRDE